jgi:hypothetical protein
VLGIQLCDGGGVLVHRRLEIVDEVDAVVVDQRLQCVDVRREVVETGLDVLEAGAFALTRTKYPAKFATLCRRRLGRQGIEERIDQRSFYRG